MAEIITVTALNRYVKNLLERDAVLDGLAIRGEISGFVNHYKSGHYYFSLRDEQCAVKAVMFSRDARRVPFMPENGMKVILRGRVSLFERDGSFQLYVEEMIPDGVGAMQLALEQLKTKLAKEGLFDAAHKKPLPTEPHYIGVVTSATGAALQDIRNVLSRRWPVAKILLSPATVQGQLAAKEIPQAIRLLEQDGRAQVIIVARGGGSKEDLWVFNDEGIARAAYACKIPLVSAVGHEIDTCILDLVADLRAPTPSAAAELCTPDQQQIVRKIQILQENIQNSMQKRMGLWYTAYNRLYAQMQSRQPRQQIAQRKQQLEQYEKRLSQMTQAKLSAQQQRFQAAASLCAGLNPYHVLARGYAMLQTEKGEIIPAKQPVQPESKIVVRRAEEDLHCVVQKVTAKKGNLE